MQLRAGEQNGLLAALRPALERPFVKSFSQYAHPSLVPPEDLEQVATLIGKDPQVAALRFIAELRPVVAAQVATRAVERDQIGQRRDDVAGAEPTAGDDIQAVVAVLVDDRQEFHRVAALV